MTKWQAFYAQLIAIFLVLSGVLFVQRSLHNVKAFAIDALESTIMFVAPSGEYGRTNVLLLGVGDKEHAAADLTDVILVASIDTKTNSVMMLSIPRDLYFPEVGYAPAGKVNAFYVYQKQHYVSEGMSEFEASRLALKDFAEELGTRLHVPIHGVVKVDFTGFTKAVDALGGVDIDVPRDITDYEYPLAEGKVGLFHLKAGMQHLDGETALRFARSRHDSSDFDRSHRQQLLLSALEEKIRRERMLTNISQIMLLQQSLSGHSEWTFTSPQLLSLAAAVHQVPGSNIVGMNIKESNGPGGFVYRAPQALTGSGYYLYPYNKTRDPGDWSQVGAFASFFLGHPELYIGRPVVEVSAPSRIYSHAYSLTNELEKYGLNVSAKSPRTTSNTGSGYIAIGHLLHRAAVASLAEILDVPVERADEKAESSVTIVLDSRYRFVPFQVALQNSVLKMLSYLQ